MPALQTFSYRFSNVAGIAQDLLQGVDSFGGNIGFLTVDADAVDCAALIKELAGAAPFPVVGSTTLAFPALYGRDDISASLCVFGAEGFACSIAVSDVLDKDLRESQMQALYRRCVDGLDGEPRLFFTYVPPMGKLEGESFMHQLFGCAGQTPVVGGMASADLDTDDAAVFAGGQRYNDRIVLIAFGGGVQPVFAVANQITRMSEHAPRVTKSDENVVYTVDDQSFTDYMAQIGLADDTSVTTMDALFQYGPLPAHVIGKLADDDGVPEVRAIVSTDPATGTGTFSSAIPEGARLGVGVLNRSDIAESTRRCLATLKDRAAPHMAGGYKYSMLFSLSCMARHFAQVGGADEESAAMLAAAPEDAVIHSFYCFSEIGATLGKTGEVHNRTFAESIVMCAI